MKPVVRYEERVKTVFCANCQTRVMDLPIRDAAEIERQQVPIHCTECMEIVADIAELDKQTASWRQAIEDLLRIQTERVREQMVSVEATKLLMLKRLEEIKQKRVRESQWAASNN